ncbi:hypothetical protein [Pseudoduganella buxea]|uniref:Uncharacterized protein n=1 Tax=Pseudoduganella buxea TaxID=1949069 RepID=A0A6I3SSU3_9BURK|nr:hypothetical protein [Pseudoduganella buxea]MTV52171.1 hypothetical protein [Pseudoduganella buxea]GGB94196.1 hypothetical protein GCM10011572_15200 [Pseudoduganella buxea]
MAFRTIAAGLLVACVAQCAMAAETNTSAELANLFKEDQADRKAQEIDWSVVGARDAERERRVKALIAADALKSGMDYLHAAMILQHAHAPEDHLLAHELCVIAIAKGEHRAKWLAAASLDRFLTGIDRPQRFGTQYQSKGRTDPPVLLPVDPAVTDALRREMSVPTLAEAKRQETEYAKEFEERKKRAGAR